jgi:hypothetical protein
MSDPKTDSPCINVCVVDLDTGHCIGCGRSRTEIAGWARFDSDEKARIVSGLPARLSDMTTKRKRRGGRRSRHGM